MGALLEHEIVSCLKEHLDLAITHCELLASAPAKGAIYKKLRTELRRIEGCCKQMSQWREDTRWLPIGLAMHEAHMRAHRWLVGEPLEGGGRRYPSAHLFLKLADNLRSLKIVAASVKDDATGKLGMILPEPIRPDIKTQGRSIAVPAGYQPSPGGLLVPV